MDGRDILAEAFAAARARRARVVLPEAEDARIREAAQRLGRDALAEPLTLADARPAAAYTEHILRQRPALKPALALRMLEKPLIRAAAMVAAGEAEAMVAGAVHPTRRVIEAAALAIGMAEGVATPSSFFLMRLPGGRHLVFADCAVNVAPDAAQLADIARASAASGVALLGTARLALLSFSTGASGSGPSVERVRAAAEALRAEGLEVKGPVQADAALNPVIAAKKGLEAGDPANVLIFPDLDSGNIAYKLVQELAGAQAIGPFLQGFAKPVCDLSRGASVEDIVAATVLTLAQCEGAQAPG
jgi:phosphate acetyltransferase